MKIIKLLATSLLVALSLGVNSCSKEENTPETGLISSSDLFFRKYGIEIKDYDYPRITYIDNILVFNAFKEDKFLSSAYDTLSYKKLCEFIDTESTPDTITKYIGYGEYKDLYLSRIINYGIALTENGYIGMSGILYVSRFGSLEKQITYFSNGKKKEFTNNDYSDGGHASVKKWFNDSAIVLDSICYNDKGDTIFIAKKLIHNNETPITYTDGVKIDFNSQRINHATGEIIWESKLIPPFEIPSNAKNDIIILEKGNESWKCKVNTLFYDGEKKNFTFEININDGTIDTVQNFV